MAKTKKKKSKKKIKKQSLVYRFKNDFTTVQQIILVVIALTFVAVFVALFCALTLKTEDIVKSSIASRSADYYENYLYEEFVSSDKFSKIGDLDKAMSKYADRGFSKVRLSEILFHNSSEVTDDITRIINYCDEDESFVQFFPDPPFTKTSYHIEYSLACSF